MSQTLKVLLSLLFLVVLVVGASFYMDRILRSTTQEMESQISQVESSSWSGDWKNAETHLEKVIKDWDGTRKTLSVLTEHAEIDQIDAALSRMKQYVRTKDLSPALAEASALKQLIRHIPQKESLNWENLF